MTVRLSTLANGLRVVTHEMATVETASVGVWVGAGTRNEPAEINGVAHLLEHMAFKGTRRRSAADIAMEIENVGGHLNAYTSRESTVYYAKVLKDDVPLALDLLADILLNATFDPEELSRERAVVLQEIGQANDTPEDIVFDRFQATAYPDQPLGRPVLGLPEVVGGMSREQVLDHMRQTYGSERMVVAAAGRVSHDAIVEAVEGLFGPLQSNVTIYSEPALYTGGDFREDRDLEQLHLILGFPGLPYDDEDYYALSMLSMLFGGGMSSRLFQEIREKRGLVYSIYTFASSYRDSGLLGIYAGTGPKEGAELVDAICGEIVRLPDSDFGDEILRARKQLISATVMSLESTGARCDQLGQQTLAFGAPIPVDEQLRRIEAVDAAALARVARQVFTGSPTVAAMGLVDTVPDYRSVADRLGG
jgi:predicted Zn-dependent peptidase